MDWLCLALFWVEGSLVRPAAGRPTLGARPAVSPLVRIRILACLVGLWFSVAAKNSLRALIGALVNAGGLCLGPWLMGLVLVPLLLMSAHPVVAVRHLTLVQVGMTPPLALPGLAFSDSQSIEFATKFSKGYLNILPATAALTNPSIGDVEPIYPSPDAARVELNVLIGVGLLFWLLVAYGLWRRTLARFQGQTCRQPDLSPEIASPEGLSDARIAALLRRAQAQGLVRSWLPLAALVALCLGLPPASTSTRSARAKKPCTRRSAKSTRPIRAAAGAHRSRPPHAAGRPERGAGKSSGPIASSRPGWMARPAAEREYA